MKLLWFFYQVHFGWIAIQDTGLWYAGNLTPTLHQTHTHLHPHPYPSTTTHTYPPIHPNQSPSTHTPTPTRTHLPIPTHEHPDTHTHPPTPAPTLSQTHPHTQPHPLPPNRTNRNAPEHTHTQLNPPKLRLSPMLALSILVGFFFETRFLKKSSLGQDTKLASFFLAEIERACSRTQKNIALTSQLVKKYSQRNNLASQQSLLTFFFFDKQKKLFILSWQPTLLAKFNRPFFVFFLPTLAIAYTH